MTEPWIPEVFFEVEYRDGTVFAQNSRDISMTDPKRSSFYDVRVEEVAVFTLVGHEKMLAVDLRDGHFELNGVPFHVGEVWVAPEGQALRLLFDRVHQQDVNRSTREVLAHRVRYTLGWELTLADGAPYRVVVGMD